MEGMDPKQREIVEKMVHVRMQGMVQSKPKIKRTLYSRSKGSKTVGQCRRDNYSGSKAGQKVADVCAADWSAFDVSPADFTAFREMAEMFSRLSPGGANEMPTFGDEDWKSKSGCPGIPVEEIRYRNGQQVSSRKVEEFPRGPISDDVYGVPNGFQMQQGFGQL